MPGSRSVSGSTGGIGRVLQQKLLEPTAAVTDIGKRRKARLLATFILCLIALFLSVNVGYWLTIPSYRLPTADLVGYIFLGLLYVLSRTRFTDAAVVIMLVMFPLNVFLNVIQGTSLNVTASLAFLIPSYVLAGIFTNPLGTAVYGLIVNLIVLLLPWIAPERVTGIEQILGPLSAGVITVSLTIIGMLYRDRQERDRQAELSAAYESTLVGWARALEIRDKEIEGHSRRVAELAVRLAQACGLNAQQIEWVHRGALLHDIGKMSLPDSIIAKQGVLTPSEQALMRTHPRVAEDMLSSIDYLRPALDIPAYHHEWWNGQGYPHGLKGEQIPLAARIFAVVDAWDALLSDRPYRRAWTPEQTVAHLEEQSGKQFDPSIVRRFLDLKP
jgi:putative nucleotidyltransferase with HDIG domain